MPAYSCRKTHEVILDDAWYMMPSHVAGSHEVLIKCPNE